MRSVAAEVINSFAYKKRRKFMHKELSSEVHIQDEADRERAIGTLQASIQGINNRAD